MDRNTVAAAVTRIPMVALREEGVDRNVTMPSLRAPAIPVALREEGVDRNTAKAA